MQSRLKATYLNVLLLVVAVPSVMGAANDAMEQESVGMQLLYGLLPIILITAALSLILFFYMRSPTVRKLATQTVTPSGTHRTPVNI